MNGFIKDGAREAIDDPERRRIRGAAPQSVFVAFLLFAANLRKIDEFLKKQEAEANMVRKLPSRRRTKSLSTWAPEASKKPAGIVALTGRAEFTVSLGGTLSDPDPPLTA
jgi:hypothetical protein